MKATLDILVEGALSGLDGRPVIDGTIREGVVRIGDAVEIIRPDGATLGTTVRAIEFRSGPNVRPGSVGLRIEPHDDTFIVSGAVIRSPFRP